MRNVGVRPMLRSKNHRSQRWITLVLALALALGAAQSSFARDNRYDRDPRNDSYVFATTRSVREMDVHPAVRLTILPVAIVLDVVFLPFALLADAVS